MSNSAHSQEFQLLLSCSALDKNRTVEAIKKISNSTTFDEDEFLSLLKRHHLSELAFQLLKNESFFSSSLRSQIEQLAQANQLKAIAGLAIQVRLQHFFQANGINAIYMKGLFLSHLYYGDIGKRNLVDIDVWVEESYFNQGKVFLRSLGYVSTLDHYAFNQRQLNFIHQCNHDEIFYHPGDKNTPVIELHWKLRNALGNYMFDPIKEQDKLMQVEMNGVPFSVFNHVDQFIFLCVHGAEHGWFKLKWLVDLVHLNNTIDFDWKSVVLRAKVLKSERELRLAWSLLQEFYGLTIPEKIEEIKLTTLDRLRLNYVRHLISYKGAFCDTGREKLLNLLYTLSLNRRPVLARELLLKNLTNTTDWLTLPLPSSLFFLYFPLRPFLWVYRKIKS
jgi:hypothetical protein